MKTTETKISKIVIEVAGHKIDLTIDQAHELQSILNKTFPAKQPSVTTIIERELYPPRPWIGVPMWSNEPIPNYKNWDVTCGLNQMGTLSLAAK